MPTKTHKKKPAKKSPVKKQPAVAARKRQAIADAQTIREIDPVIVQATAIFRLHRDVYGLSERDHKSVLETQLAHALDDESPRQGLAWQALHGWKQLDLTAAAKLMDVLVAVQRPPGKMVEVSDQECAVGIAGLLADNADAIDDRRTTVPFEPVAKANGTASVEERPARTFVVGAGEG